MLLGEILHYGVTCLLVDILFTYLTSARLTYKLEGIGSRIERKYDLVEGGRYSCSKRIRRFIKILTTILK